MLKQNPLEFFLEDSFFTFRQRKMAEDFYSIEELKQAIKSINSTEVGASELMNALNGMDNAHTAIHRAIESLKRGSPKQSKDLLVQVIIYCTNSLKSL